MSDMASIAVDVMGGDNAPVETVKGAVEAVNERQEVKVYLVGKEDVIEDELAKYAYDRSRIEVLDARETISNEEAPVNAIREKKNSSIVKALRLVKDGEADGFVTAGSTGAVLVGSQLILGRTRGIERAPLAPLIPTMDGMSLLIDCGANVDARASHLLQFAKIGSIYMENMVGVKDPKVAIVNIGAEEEKGNKLVKETFPLLKNCNGINFIGSIESRDIPNGYADVIVCEAFVGNVILKLYEGLASSLIKKIVGGLKSTPISMVGAALAKPALKRTLKGFDLSQYGGAPMLGLNGLVIKSHGSSKSVEIKNSVIQCVMFKRNNLNEKISKLTEV